MSSYPTPSAVLGYLRLTYPESLSLSPGHLRWNLRLTHRLQHVERHSKQVYNALQERLFNGTVLKRMKNILESMEFSRLIIYCPHRWTCLLERLWGLAPHLTAANREGGRRQGAGNKDKRTGEKGKWVPCSPSWHHLTDQKGIQRGKRVKIKN